MIKITFTKPTGGTYWAVCKNLSQYDRLEGYDLDGVLENSRGTGPAGQITVPANWQIIQVEEV